MSKILLVDDAALARLQYRNVLTQKGYDIEEAVSGAEAVMKYRHTKPDGVLLDINMPGISGINALYEIMEFDPEARIAMISCIESKTVMDAAIKAGARDFIVKPAGRDLLIERIEKLLS